MLKSKFMSAAKDGQLCTLHALIPDRKPIAPDGRHSHARHRTQASGTAALCSDGTCTTAPTRRNSASPT